jgi:hypothetical protein
MMVYNNTQDYWRLELSLRPTVSSVGSLCYVLAGFLMGRLVGKSESFVKTSGHFVQLLKSINLQSLDTPFCQDVSLFSNVPVEETLQKQTPWL